MKTSPLIFLSLISNLFFWSCSVSHINEKLIIGDWTKEKTKSFIINKKYADDTNYTIANKLRLGIDSLNTIENEKASLIEFRNEAKLDGSSKVMTTMSNMKNEMDFKPDKTAIISFRKGKLVGTWKMNSNGNKVMVKDSVTHKKIIITINKIDSTKMLISESFPKGDLMIVFRKK